MQIEYEVKFREINPDEVRQKLQINGWICTIPLRRMQKYVFAHPSKKNAYIRIRQEWHKTTTSYKEEWLNNTIDSVQEIEVTIDNAAAMRQFFLQIWLREKAIQESYRETWEIDWNVVTIDRRPWLKPFIEVEWPDAKSVENCSEKLWYSMDDAIFWTVSDIYFIELWIPKEKINETNVITFDSPPLPFMW
jgi:predicted adenylyl cyclase CyaB